MKVHNVFLPKSCKLELKQNVTGIYYSWIKGKMFWKRIKY